MSHLKHNRDDECSQLTALSIIKRKYTNTNPKTNNAATVNKTAKNTKTEA